MTVSKLIERLEQMKKVVGGDAVVKVADGDEEFGFCLTPVAIEDPDSETGLSNMLLIDLTGEPE